MVVPMGARVAQQDPPGSASCGSAIETPEQVSPSTTVVDEALVRRLVSAQFPRWARLPVTAISPSRWDNRSFRLGAEMLVRLPSAAEYASQIEKEQFWLPRLSSLLPLEVPTPLAMGQPAEGYPWKWSIYRWIDGDDASREHIADPNAFAGTLAQFLIALHRIDPKGGPQPGPHNFHRGGSLQIYDAETARAIAALGSRIDAKAAASVWRTALETTWARAPVWVHGDVSAPNLLVRDGKLSAVIDFGMLAIGDPACDLSIAWTLFEGESRAIFRAMLPFDSNTWARARGWTLWKALIVAAGLVETNAVDSPQSLRVVDAVLGAQ